jgi:hypothetical protein
VTRVPKSHGSPAGAKGKTDFCRFHAKMDFLLNPSRPLGVQRDDGKDGQTALQPVLWFADQGAEGCRAFKRFRPSSKAGGPLGRPRPLAAKMVG